MMNILIIDNFDSFTYNLYQSIGELCKHVNVVRNNEIPFNDIEGGVFSHIVISPGPGNPTDETYFGSTKKVINDFHKKYPLLGVCLGHQGLGAFFGASVIKAPIIMHGKTSTFKHNSEGLFKDINSDITVMRYHSLVIDPRTVPDDLIIDAVAGDGSIMAFHHKIYPTFGVQFHPESFRTEMGSKILSNFLKEESYGV
jgi:anthranilate synthase component 2